MKQKVKEEEKGEEEEEKGKGKKANGQTLNAYHCAEYVHVQHRKY